MKRKQRGKAMLYRYIQELGLPDVTDTIRQFMTSPGQLGAATGGGGLALLGASISSAFTERYVFIGMTGMWLAWMLLGLFVAMHQNEKFDMRKVTAGIIHMGAALVIFLMGWMVDLMVAAGQPYASTAVGGFMVTAFGLKAAAKGSYFFKGLRELMQKFLPGATQGVGDIQATRALRESQSPSENNV